MLLVKMTTSSVEVYTLLVKMTTLSVEVYTIFSKGTYGFSRSDDVFQ